MKRLIRSFSLLVAPVAFILLEWPGIDDPRVFRLLVDIVVDLVCSPVVLACEADDAMARWLPSILRLGLYSLLHQAVQAWRSRRRKQSR